MNGNVGQPGPAETDGCCGSIGAEEDGMTEGSGAIAERLFPIPGDIEAKEGVGEMSSLFFLRPPKTRFNLAPAPPEDVGAVGDGGGAAAAGSDGDRDCT